MRALIFVESPLQLLNAMEAVHSFSLTSYKIVIRLSGFKISDLQLINTAKALGLNSVSVITINAGRKNLFDLIKIIYYSNCFLFSKIDYVFIGNEDSNFFRKIIFQFNKRKIVFLDDGSKTIVLANSENKLDKVYYSVFSLSQINVLEQNKNKYHSLKERLSQSNFKINHNKIIFLGQKLAELGILPERDYLTLIIEFSKKYNNFEIDYIPHRGEDLGKLSAINKLHNVEIVDLDYPVELYGLYNSFLPHKVTSFYSTALYTMKIIYPIQVESILISTDNLEFKKNIDLIYDFYKINNIVESSSCESVQG